MELILIAGIILAVICFFADMEKPWDREPES